MDYRLTNVKALWPKLDRAYKFDPTPTENRPKGGSIACDATDPDGKYEMHVIMSDEQAKDLANQMRKAWKESDKTKAEPFYATDIEDIFPQNEDNTGRIAKLVKKTYQDANSKPRQYMKDGSKAAEDFQLTTNSTIHVMLKIYPWSFAGKTGVQLRPEGVMVVELAEREQQEQSNPFNDLVEAPSDAVANEFADLLDGKKAETKTDKKSAFGGDLGKKDKQAALNDLDDEIPF